jgi:hypothetical protein
MAIFLENVHARTIIIRAPIGYRVCFSGVKRPESKADHSLPYSVEVKNKWNYTSTPSHIPAWCRQEQLYLLDILWRDRPKWARAS